ncbi:MAG TPA: undecaprenyl-diphosphatase [Eoetvoesiella sp.]|jgi:undecaprenyl-diphosphatase|uniref:undecaprenyl-diphosphatase n=1 Tax=Eoetvoesiella sp. TaxID=1966355 RepID=UPI002CA52DC6|nr:undecaprenyl-diphosphatase [Eoetvoesiella sp.]HWK62920.1 undecaprenyl-diphosphatase [Eoetvoesiella sp.]
MEAINQSLFLWLNAPDHPDHLILSIAIFLARDLIWAIPALIGIGWLYGGARTRQLLLVATASAILGLFANQLISLFWWHPRPFMVYLGHTLIAHAPDSSFPSDHLTLWWAVAFSFLAQGRHNLGTGLALLGVPLAWSRIYLGVHFPLDMVGAGLVAVASTWLSLRTAFWYLPPAFHLATLIHRKIFSPLIACGWVKR